jgi:serine/threonine protein phosphatase PrpC
MSRIACGAVLESFSKHHDIEQAFAAGNNAAIQVSKWIDNPDCGATLLVGALVGDKMKFAWCGDSVAYRLHGGVLSLLTPADRSANSNVLISAIGYDSDLKPLMTSSDVEEGDRFLLCTDGVWTVFEESGRLGDLMNLMVHGDNAPLIASKICSEARTNGYDDASAIMIIIDESVFEDDDLGLPASPSPIEKTPPPEEGDPSVSKLTPPPEIRNRGGVSDVRN